MTAINISEITSGSLTGTGAFDEIMTAMQLRLTEEYDQGRITGSDYATVYLGAMTNSMQQAVAFVLGKQTSDSQAELLKAQKLEVDAQTNNVVADTTNKGKQGLLLDEQKLEVIAQTAGIAADTLNKGKQGSLIDKQILQAAEAILLSTEQRTNLITERADIVAKTVNQAKQGIILDNQATKVAAEEDLLKHKSVNEQAQRKDTITETDGITTASVTGIIGKQKNLYQAQTDGFSRDAEQKLAKIMADTWNVRRTTDSALSTAGTGLEDVSINAVIVKAKAGIGA